MREKMGFKYDPYIPCVQALSLSCFFVFLVAKAAVEQQRIL